MSDWVGIPTQSVGTSLSEHFLTSRSQALRGNAYLRIDVVNLREFVGATLVVA